MGRVALVYLDGRKHFDQMRSLGLFGGVERLPAMAFNTKDGRQLPFSERLPINRDTVLQFLADFLSGRLSNKVIGGGGGGAVVGVDVVALALAAAVVVGQAVS